MTDRETEARASQPEAEFERLLEEYAEARVERAHQYHGAALKPDRRKQMARYYDARDALRAYVARLTADAARLGQERYWCGCVRYARWDRCERHGALDHDDEPPTRAQEERDAARAAETPDAGAQT